MIPLALVAVVLSAGSGAVAIDHGFDWSGLATFVSSLAGLVTAIGALLLALHKRATPRRRGDVAAALALYDAVKSGGLVVSRGDE